MAAPACVSSGSPSRLRSRCVSVCICVYECLCLSVCVHVQWFEIFSVKSCRFPQILNDCHRLCIDFHRFSMIFIDVLWSPVIFRGGKGPLGAPWAPNCWGSKHAKTYTFLACFNHFSDFSSKMLIFRWRCRQTRNYYIQTRKNHIKNVANMWFFALKITL